MGFSGYERNKLFVNPGKGEPFVQLADVAQVAEDADGRAVAPFDMDGDGRLDLAVQSLDGITVYWNQIHDPGHFIQLVLVPAGPDKTALHAEVRVTAQGRTTLDRVRLTAGFHTQVMPRLHVGLGTAQQADTVSIRWPSGREQVVTALKAGGRYMITEGSETVRSLPRPQWTPSQSPVPIRAPTLDLLVNDEHGESVALGETGRPTLVNLWAPWCVPCGQEAPQLQAFAAENASWIQVVGVSVERDTLRRTRSSFGDMASHPNRVATETFLESVFTRGDVPLPTTLLFDASGRLIRRYSRPLNSEDLEAIVAPLRVKAATEDWMWSSEFSRTDGDPMGAVAHLEKAVALSPQSIPLYLELAMTAAQQPNLSKTALRAVQDALRIAPSHPVAWEVYSLVSERFERPDAALKFLETAPETSAVQAFRARVLERLKRPQGHPSAPEGHRT